MKIQMLVSLANGKDQWTKDAIYNVEDALAAQWVASGHALAIDAPASPESAPVLPADKPSAQPARKRVK